MEQSLIDEIIYAYIKNNSTSTFEYREIIKLMKLSKFSSKKKRVIQNIINNALIIIIVLFLRNNRDNYIENHSISEEERNMIKVTFEALIIDL